MYSHYQFETLTGRTCYGTNHEFQIGINLVSWSQGKNTSTAGKNLKNSEVFQKKTGNYTT